MVMVLGQMVMVMGQVYVLGLVYMMMGQVFMVLGLVLMVMPTVYNRYIWCWKCVFVEIMLESVYMTPAPAKKGFILLEQVSVVFEPVFMVLGQVLGVGTGL